MKALLMLVRLTWVIGLALGIYIWTGHGYAMLSPHIGLGFTTTFLMLILAIWAGTRGCWRPAVIAIVFALLLPVVGFGQLHWMPGPQHWVVRAFHVIIGVAALGAVEALVARATRTA
ncbi:MAG TPA: hypothetical protein VGC88_06225 [Terriglobales bacterium]|jgi:hypothetical protein